MAAFPSIAVPPAADYERFDAPSANDRVRTPWDRPEASINQLVATYGAWSCWDFLPDSPAGKLLTSQIQEDIMSDLEARLSRGERTSIDCWVCEFWMVGMVAATACPTVVFCYPFEAKIRKKARDIIRAKIKQSRLHNVRVKSLNRGCPIEATGAQKDAVGEGRPLDTRGDRNEVQPGTVKLKARGMPTCGSRIDTYYSLPDLHCSATLGGLPLRWQGAVWHYRLPYFPQRRRSYPGGSRDCLVRWPTSKVTELRLAEVSYVYPLDDRI
jgi:hypothetical protein